MLVVPGVQVFQELVVVPGPRPRHQLSIVDRTDAERFLYALTLLFTLRPAQLSNITGPSRGLISLNNSNPMISGKFQSQTPWGDRRPELGQSWSSQKRI